MHARLLTEADQPRLESFLKQHTDRSLFLLNNLSRSGLVAGDEPYHGQYWGAFEGDELVGAAALYWNGMIIPSAPEGLEALAEVIQREADRPIAGFVGDQSQVDWLAEWFGCRVFRVNSPERLFALELTHLEEPEMLKDPDIECRLATPEDQDQLVQWRLDYDVELMGADYSEQARERAEANISKDIQSGVSYVLARSGVPVAMSCFNAALDTVVQIGGVFTPPSERGKGYGRAVVAGSLLQARERGVGRSILFTGFSNEPAQRAYQALGYRPIGAFCLKVLKVD
ncbi:GNAT family N-acetyltransferase [Saccharospirillum salsuginis]|uniref:N-acetyltransferase n=1 Tax=Saccharospirillum salsuginis TaxID=418750 RepID=A0A918KD87_9GAMM|nr:GNAT family N-acetyltransferase [Saccharospirillum salsuginis]GGX58222.1 N-acetyltransferase [Saccharospirillum salsuginis]